MSNGNGQNGQDRRDLPALDVQLTAGNIFTSAQAFNLAVRMADAFSKSTVVPREYQGNTANCLIAVEQACRLNTSPLMVMQNLYIIQGRPAWSSQFIISMINASGRFKTELQYDLAGAGKTLSCYAYAINNAGRKVTGPVITMAMAEAEGWVSKNGSKWKTMPEIMIRYRAASFFGRLNCPDLVMGIYSSDEVLELPESQYKVTNDPVETAIFANIPERQIASEQSDEPTESEKNDNTGEIQPDAKEISLDDL